MAIQTLLVFRWPLEFPDVALNTLHDCGTVGSSGHVFMSCGPVTVHTLQTFFSVITVAESDHSLFDSVIELENNFVTFQASLGSEIIISQIFRRHKRVAEVPKHVPPFRSESNLKGMTLITTGLV
jgi:hypothetical protein